ncbi:U-actitoxin-Avd3i-like [Anastrepha ludens]|uniref:U-actitoxin-Avd3i-like n=1 Tax=Anastrepha ludens TaxID=28586 RepID=UPI0023B19C2B|nr:U-actitoxin-Avd3i-like [Anastrepha ludens]
MMAYAMKSVIFFCFFLMVFSLNAYAQQCGPLNSPTCGGSADPGFGGGGCNEGVRWYYNGGSRRCESFYYWGCAGNSNRYCTQFACQQRCEIF